ncbi:hypothetical protein [Polyangium spumosum]|uniref:Uncharacterized protein n=1 Tax=Polyangium spumosum TaxID=889282 RepID=A0A6N7Q0G1_9BACT|nr:hypothetical protein [Polyangium spumosum]MRG96656.1 hypothetical protein [Polyangium spumosum]
MYGHGTLLVTTAALLVSFGSQAEPQASVVTPDPACFTSLGVRLDDPGSIPGGQDPERIELFLDGRPCIHIAPEGEACVMRAPAGAVCAVIAPLSIAEGWCHLGSDGSFSANFQVVASRLLADDVLHTLTAHVTTPEGLTMLEAPVSVTRYSPWSPNPDDRSVTCFQGNAAFGAAAPPAPKGPRQD